MEPSNVSIRAENQTNDAGLPEHIDGVYENVWHVLRLFCCVLPCDAYKEIHSFVPTNPISPSIRNQIWVLASTFNKDENRARSMALTDINRFQSNGRLTELKLQSYFWNFSSLPPRIPENVRRLDVSHNDLRKLRNNLPDPLRELNASHNKLRTLQNKLPERLDKLNVSHNNLRSLTNKFPEGLDELDVSHNKLGSLPNKFPRHLKVLKASHNQIEKFPARALLDLKIEKVDLSHNKIAELTETDIDTIRSLKGLYSWGSKYCYIDLTGNPLSQTTIDRLAALQSNNRVDALTANRIIKITVSENLYFYVHNTSPQPTHEANNPASNTPSNIESVSRRTR